MDEGELSLGKISDAKILLVDDDSVQANQLIEKISHINKNIKLVSNPDEAIDVANKGEFDLAVISTQLVNADGLRICSQLRSHEQTRNMSILIVIEEDDNQSMLKGMEIGVNDYIATPVDTNELVARAKTLIRRKKYQDALRSNFKTSISLAVTDGLTGLYNRRFMDTHIEQLVKEAQDYQKPLAVLMMDIDHFKRVNDTFGHNVGDEVIKEFAQRILRSVRPSDLAVRYGGEEFVVILPGTLKEDAKVVADRLRNNIEKVPFTVSTEEGILSKTVSIGIAGLKPNETAEQILKRADDALYKAKNGGRNQCIVSEEQ
jgi:two-component system cell cycle response regulator